MSNATCERLDHPIVTTRPSLPALLLQRAARQPDAAAYTFIDYEQDPAGFAETVTWSQVHRRTLAVADELRRYGSAGDRAAILAPEGLDYIAAFLGALLAGFIAVPLPAPDFRIHDERILAALRDCSPSIILTTSSMVDDVTRYARLQDHSHPSRRMCVIEVDSLDFDSPRYLDPIYSAHHHNTAYLQYTSGSTRQPAGVMVSHRNVLANLDQMCNVSFANCGNRPPQELSFVSWLPFHHDMGLIFTIFTPMFTGNPVEFIRPLSFVQRPARWMQMLGSKRLSYSCAPNFALELAARGTSDEDMVGLDLGGVLAINSGAERVQPATVKEFTRRFARFNLRNTVIRPSYGLAEATLWVASPHTGRPAAAVRFDNEQLSRGYAKPCNAQQDCGAELVGHGEPRMCDVRIVDPDRGTENPPGEIGEIWIHGANVASGYWQKPAQTKHTFGGRIAAPSPRTAQGPWLRSGDLGVMFDGELFIVGRMKDMLIVEGRNHYPDDIEATIQRITQGRVAAVSVSDDRTEQLVVIAEISERTRLDGDETHQLRAIKRDIVSAIAAAHGLRVADLVLVAPGCIPTTSSGKVRRSTCGERYRKDEFKRLDSSPTLVAEA
ncbi:MAG: AMP-binding protein [Mycobacterium sp.]|nr:AMP-binding protein [Mycobacterium sp.]MBV9722763.1 AMP-binding protein [Mycobacterium sp.]